VFSRSLHLQAGADFLCLGDRSIGRGPLNAILAGDGWAQLGAAALSAGDAAVIDGRCIRVGGSEIDTAAATAWRFPPWPPLADGELPAQAVETLLRLSRARAPAPAGCLARMVVEPGAGRAPTLKKFLRPGIERLRAWLGEVRLQAPRTPPPVDLLGLGTGLTPSGDDLLCGTLVALYAVGWRREADWLGRAVAGAAPAATSPLSGAFLRAAAQGLGCEPLHATIAAVLTGGAEMLATHLRALDRIGHTSGWDALAGAMLVFQAFSLAGGQSASVASPMLSL
jgi:hypothetical protein